MIYVLLTLIFVIALVNLVFTMGISFFLIRMVESLRAEAEAGDEEETQEREPSALELYDQAVEQLERESALVDFPMPKVRSSSDRLEGS